MANVKFKQGSFANLPTSAESNELLFVLDQGKIYKGTGSGTPLVPFSDVLFGYTDLADLQTKVPVGTNGKLYLSDDNKLYRFRNGSYDLVSSSQIIDTFEADKVTFDKTATTLTGTNVQDAIVELDNKVVANEGKVKITVGDTAGYLSDKVDGTTVVVENNKLVVKSIEGLTVGSVDINKLSGVTTNVQSQLDTLDDKIDATSSGMNYGGTVATHADLGNITNPVNGTLVVVLADENHSGARGAYIYNSNTTVWDYFGTFDMAEAFIDLTDTPNAHVADKYLVSDGSKLIFTDLDYSVLVNKPTSSVANIDQAVADMHTHTNKAQLDKFTEGVDGKPLYDGQPIGAPVLEWESFGI